MSFVQVGGDSQSKPTYFEVLAADNLVPSLKAAVIYALSVLSQRYPWLHSCLRYEDELLSILLLLIDWHSLSTCDGTFAEGMYGLRRRRIDAKGVQSPGTERMTVMQRRMGLLLQVLILNYRIFSPCTWFSHLLFYLCCMSAWPLTLAIGAYCFRRYLHTKKRKILILLDYWS